MSKSRKIKLRQRRRPIEDVPFYKIEHSSDDLPFDPFRPFIREEISMSHIFSFKRNAKNRNCCDNSERVVKGDGSSSL